MQVGYASGFISRFMGRPILFREVECKAQGAPHCRIVGKPADEWIGSEGAEDDLRSLRADAITAGMSARGEKPVAASPLGSEDVVGVSAGFNAACHKLRRVADTRATVLFLGESGVGKEVLADAIHAWSRRSAGPLVKIN